MNIGVRLLALTAHLGWLFGGDAAEADSAAEVMLTILGNGRRSHLQNRDSPDRATRSGPSNPTPENRGAHHVSRSAATHLVETARHRTGACCSTALRQAIPTSAVPAEAVRSIRP